MLYDWMTPEVEKSLNKIKEYFNQIKSTNDYLRAENEKLKNEHYKDEELAGLEAENRKLKSYLEEGCYITPKEREAIRKWMAEHERPMSLEFIFQPTGIGTIGIAKCSRYNEEFVFRNI